MGTAVGKRRLTLANDVRARRLACGWTQGALAVRAGLHRNTVVKVESEGLDWSPSVEVMLALAEALGCDIWDVFWTKEDAA